MIELDLCPHCGRSGADEPMWRIPAEMCINEKKNNQSLEAKLKKAEALVNDLKTAVSIAWDCLSRHDSNGAISALEHIEEP